MKCLTEQEQYRIIKKLKKINDKLNEVDDAYQLIRYELQSGIDNIVNVIGSNDTEKDHSNHQELVRCKDCIHWGYNFYEDVETCFEHRNVDGTEQVTSPDDYCSWGKKRNE